MQSNAYLHTRQCMGNQKGSTQSIMYDTRSSLLTISLQLTQSVPGCIKLCFTRVSSGTGCAKSDDRQSGSMVPIFGAVSCFRCCFCSPLWVESNTLLWANLFSWCSHCCFGTLIVEPCGCLSKALAWVTGAPLLCCWKELSVLWYVCICSCSIAETIVKGPTMSSLATVMAGVFKCFARLGKAAETLAGILPVLVPTCVNLIWVVVPEGSTEGWLALLFWCFSSSFLNFLEISFCCTKHCRSCFCFVAKLSSCPRRDLLLSAISCWEQLWERVAWVAASSFLVFWLARPMAFKCRSISDALSCKLSTAQGAGVIPVCMVFKYVSGFHSCRNQEIHNHKVQNV